MGARATSGAESTGLASRGFSLTHSLTHSGEGSPTPFAEDSVASPPAFCQGPISNFPGGEPEGTRAPGKPNHLLSEQLFSGQNGLQISGERGL